MAAEVARLAHVADLLVVGARASQLCLYVEEAATGTPSPKHISHLTFRLELQFTCVKAAIEWVFRKASSIPTSSICCLVVHVQMIIIIHATKHLFSLIRVKLVFGSRSHMLSILSFEISNDLDIILY